MRTSIPLLALLVAAATLAPAQSLEDFVPSVAITAPVALVGQVAPAQLGFSPTIDFDGADPDGDQAIPTSFRFLFKRAKQDDGTYATTRQEVLADLDHLAAFSDSSWSSWQPWPADPQQRRLTFGNLPELDNLGQRIYYLLAVQVMDTVGAVSLAREYGVNLGHFHVGTVSPVLRVYEPLLMDWSAAGQVTGPGDIAPGTYTFEWAADASAYGGEIVAYRWGFDLIDPDDPNDPGWDGPPGLDLANRTTGSVVITGGIHSLTIRAEDDDGGLTRVQFVMTVVPTPDPADQRQLLLVDDVYDRNSNAWQGAPPQNLTLDRDIYRDQFWLGVLLGEQGVAGFHFENDIVDTEVEDLGYRDLVEYRNVIWSSRASTVSFVSREFRPYGWPDAVHVLYNWLETYQRSVGNLLLVGSGSADNFLPGQVYPALPEADLGMFTTPLGEVLPWSGRFYPDRGLGVAMYDVAQPFGEIYGHPGATREAACTGVKSVIMPVPFWSEHQIVQSPYPILPIPVATDGAIDWRDLDPAFAYDLANVYRWGGDEFYDQDVVDRPEAWSPRDCAGQPCVEPMWTAISRYDWLQMNASAAGHPDWPAGYYSPADLDDLCGELAFVDGQQDAVTQGTVVGFLSHRHDQTKPSGVADVVWGFDPYRFDHEVMKNAVRWVLDSHFGVVMNPVK